MDQHCIFVGLSRKPHTAMVDPPRKRSSPPSSGGRGGAAKKTKRSSSPSSKTSPDTKASKGLRHFSMKVCRKVEEKGKTTYNEVADELVREVMAERSDEPRGKYDEKNIRRRVYDALNVLMAMDIISKEKKEILWKGLPSNAHHDLGMLKREGQALEKEVERKRESLRELLVQQVCFRNLVEHNRKSEQKDDEKIPLPFIVVNTHSTAVIQCEMSSDRTDVMFDFSMPFEINDDNTILKRLGMYVKMPLNRRMILLMECYSNPPLTSFCRNKATMPALQEMLPPDMLEYCQEHGMLESILVSPEPAGRMLASANEF